MELMLWFNISILCLALVAATTVSAGLDGASEVTIKSTVDGADQKAIFYIPPVAKPDGGTPTPLLVALHTWSGDYKQANDGIYFKLCVERKWTMIFPNFRGPNWTPQGCASDLAVQDVLDAVEYARKHACVDNQRIYLVGASGGGYMSLVMAHRAPAVWAGVSAWVPISDLTAWHTECKAANRGYYKHIEASCGGPPSPATHAEYHKRSPLFHLAAAKGLPLDINAGIHDGHAGSVPVSHTLRAFNVVADANGCPEAKVADADIASITASQKVPASLTYTGDQPKSRRHKVLLQRAAGPARVTIFEGGHEIDNAGAIAWLAEQRRK